MGKTYSIPGGGSYSADDVREPSAHGWSDSVGKRLARSAKSAVNSFNTAHSNVWGKIEPLLDVHEYDVTYTSQRYDIERLVIDE